MNDNLIDKEISDEEFDKWLGKMLKDDMVSPPEDFTSDVLAMLESARLKGRIDPFMLLILIGVLLVYGSFMVFPYILTDVWLQKISNFFVLKTFSQISSAVIIISAVVAIGLIFVGIDYLLSKRFGGATINIA